MKIDKSHAIGVFDSGLGGLTAVKELKKILPNEDIVYFGDTGRVPYGSRSKETIISYASQDIAFLLSKNVKIILAACGTVSTVLPEHMCTGLPVGYMGVVEAAAKSAAALSKNGKIAIIGTEATISSGGYSKALHEINPDISCISNACPLFVPFVENGHFQDEDPYAVLGAKEYLEPIKNSGADTLILGCTHYPLLYDVINRELGGKVQLVDPGKEAACLLKKRLSGQNLLNGGEKKGECHYFVSDDPEKFGRLAEIFLGGRNDEKAARINIDSYRLSWMLKGWLVGLE